MPRKTDQRRSALGQWEREMLAFRRNRAKKAAPKVPALTANPWAHRFVAFAIAGCVLGLLCLMVAL